ncbi:MAG TPA: hypothetical protein VFR86_24695 [Burkholderiaceae bacterium]|nr:hypothetical protein [Burkholderiaceae bacterium]
MYLKAPADSEAASRLYTKDLEEQGFVMNLSRLWAWRPEVCEGFQRLRDLLTGSSSLSHRELGVIVCATAANLGDSYCALAWGKRLAKAAGADTAAAVLTASQSENLSKRENALAAWARKVVAGPNETTADDVEALRISGFTEQEIFEATTFIAFRIAFSTVNDALGAKPDSQLAAAAPPEVRNAVAFGRPIDGQ